ncbi:hypothetical protein [Enterobacter hormaechei]|uniref:hypothetical protein n=1 Tax=Enterobacter hormaechei TaxID=158836 RepID=UPI0032DA793E
MYQENSGVFNKFDFKWKNITPQGINKANGVSVYNNTILVGTDIGIASKEQDSDWVFTKKTTDGKAISDVRYVNSFVQQVHGLIQQAFEATNGLGVIEKQGDDVAWHNNELPGSVVNHLIVQPSMNKVQPTADDYGAVCTDNGLYIFMREIKSGFTHTTNDGLPGNNILYAAISNCYIAVCTDKGLALGPLTVTPKAEYKNITPAQFDGRTISCVYTEGFPEDEYTPLAQLNTGRVIASDTKKIMFSDSAGTDWRDVTPGELSSGATVNCVYLYGGAFYAGTTNGLLVSYTKGLSWNRYTKDDGLPDNNIVSISADPVYDTIVLSTGASVASGTLFRWDKSVQGLPDAMITSIVRADNKDIFYAGTAKGLYQSRDGCQSWVLINNELFVYCLLYTPFSDTLYVGTDGEGLLQYTNATSTTPVLNSTFTTEDGLISNQIIRIAGEPLNAFEHPLALAHLTHSGGISYTHNARLKGVRWENLTPQNSNLPSPYVCSVKFINDKLYCCGESNPLGGDGYAFFATSDRWSENTPISLTINFTNGESLASVNDSSVVGNITFISSHDKQGAEDAPGDIRSSTDISDSSKWQMDVNKEYSGTGMMTSHNEILYIYTGGLLMCYNYKTGGSVVYPFGDFTELAPLSPYVVGEKIYLPSYGCIYISEISRLL